MNAEAEFFRRNKWLYHFTSFNTARTIILDKRLKYGMLKYTNDACENSRSILNVCNLKFLEDDIVAKIEKEIHLYRQISLSEDKHVFGRRGFDLQQMWGLYADGGCGACLVFDKDKLIESLPKGCENDSVEYEPEITPSLVTHVQGSNDIQNYIECNIHAAFFKKRKEWEHEQEYRIVKRFEDCKSEKYLSFNDSLKYVILQNSKTVKENDTILNSCEYLCLKQILPREIRILIYSHFIGRQNLLWYGEDTDDVEYWNASEEYDPLT